MHGAAITPQSEQIAVAFPSDAPTASQVARSTS